MNRIARKHPHAKASTEDRGFLVLALNNEGALLDELRTLLIFAGGKSRNDRELFRALSNRLRKAQIATLKSLAKLVHAKAMKTR